MPPLEFLSTVEWREIRPVDGARQYDRFCALQVNDDSLIDDQILDGYYAIVRLTFDDSEITPGRLVAVLAPGGLFIKHIYLEANNRIRLVSANDEYEDLIFDAGNVRIQGVVVRADDSSNSIVSRITETLNA
jgi:SOS-response transcriptional repressor LexA